MVSGKTNVTITKILFILIKSGLSHPIELIEVIYSDFKHKPFI